MHFSFYEFEGEQVAMPFTKINVEHINMICKLLYSVEQILYVILSALSSVWTNLPAGYQNLKRGRSRALGFLYVEHIRNRFMKQTEPVDENKKSLIRLKNCTPYLYLYAPGYLYVNLSV